MTDETLFELLLETPPAERADLLDRACDGKPELRAMVEGLLAAHQAENAALDVPPELPTTRSLPPPPTDRVDQTIGPYVLRQKLGEGGMGTVWVAEQTRPVKRRVALKLIKAGMDSGRIVARFQAERQALAVMDHPCIAKVLDAGATPDGRPYFAMELVKGVPITTYCDEVQATLRERLDLFVQVCSAVQHAHQKGIIHRDLKPSNILVAMHDGVAAPKVIDFGVAKALHSKLAEQTLYTEIGQVIGTLEYMAPEQAELSAMDIDTRADVYALGVLLYELLAGSTPITRDRLKKVGFAEILRVIKSEDPPRPSTRLSASSESLPSLAALRRIEPKKLASALANELDWIALKALEKNRARRYETANALAADIRRYLSDEPVEARPPSRAYRLQKFYRRNKALALGGAFVALALILGMLGTGWGLAKAKVAEADATAKFHEANAERQKADEERQKADDERGKAVAAKEAEAKQRQAAERNLLGGLLRPIGFDANNSLNPAELKSFADWSALDDGGLKVRGLKAAFDNAETALRVARRAERVSQACIGLSPARRAAALKIVSAQQRDMSADRRVRAAACWLAAELGSTDLPALESSIAALASDSTASAKEFGEFVTILVERSDPAQRRQIENVAWEALVAVLGKTTDQFALVAAGTGLAALAPRLEGDRAGRGFDALVAVLGKTTDWYASQAAGTGLAALAPRVEGDRAGRGFDALLAVLGKTTDQFALVAAGTGLAALAPRVEGDRAGRGFDALLAVLGKTTDWYASQAAGTGLAALAPRVEGDRAGRGFDALVAVLGKTTDQNTLWAAVTGLAALAPRVEGDRAGRGFDALLAVLGKTTDWYAMQAAVTGLAALAPRVEGDRAGRGFDALLAVLGKTTDQFALVAAGTGLAALAPRLEGDRAGRGFDALLAVLGKTTDQKTLWAAVTGLAALAPRVEGDRAGRGFDALLAVLGKTTGEDAMRAAGTGLATLAPRVEGDRAGRGFDALLAVLGKTTDQKTLVAAGTGLAALAPRVDPATRNQRLTSALAVPLQRVGVPDPIFAGWDDVDHVDVYGPMSQVVGSLLFQIRDPRSLAPFLSHPACVAQVRDALLSRFEELTIHAGKPLPQPRAFYTVHDAADWIAKNWPNYDLEKSMPVEWR